MHRRIESKTRMIAAPPGQRRRGGISCLVRVALMCVVTWAAIGFPTFTRSESAVLAATAFNPCTPYWTYPTGFHDNWDYSDDPTGSLGEYGLDVPLSAGTSVYAPETGTVVAYQSCPQGQTCWYPGRLLEQVGNGAVVGFGHVNQSASGSIQGGQLVATIGDQGTNSHVDFMYSLTGSYSAGRNPFMPPSPVSPLNGCRRNNWSTSGGTSVDPCVALTSYMNGYVPVPTTNMLVNASFDSGMGVNGWTKEDPNPGVETWSIPSGGARDGCCYLAAWTNNASGGHRSVLQTINMSVPVGQSHTFSVWVKTATPANVGVDLWAQGGGSTEGTYAATAPVAVNGTWTLLQSGLTVASPGHTSLLVQLVMYSANVEYDFDGAALVPNMLYNASFDSGMGVNGWTKEDPNPGVETWSIPSGGARDGGCYLAAWTNNASGGHRSVLQTINMSVPVGQSHTFSVWVKTATPANVGVDLWAQGGGSTEGTYAATAPVAVNGTWTLLQSGLTVASPGHTSLLVQLVMYSANVEYDFDGAALVPNMLVNASFDSGMGVKGWTKDNPNPGVETWVIPSGGARDGCCYLAAWTNNASGGHRSVLQTINMSVPVGQSHTFSVWVKTATPANVGVDLWAQGGGSTEGTYAATAPVAVNGTWTLLQSGLTVASPGHTSLLVQLVMYSANVEYDFDGAALVPNMLYNASFDSGMGVNGWTKEDPNPGVETWSIPSGGARDGCCYLAAWTNNASGGHRSVLQTINMSVPVGQSYTFSVWVKTATPANVGVDLWAQGGGSTEGAYAATTVAVNGTWTLLRSGLTVASPGHTSLLVQLVMYSANVEYDFDGAVLI